MNIFGYARVSSKSQNISRQIADLGYNGCNLIFSDVGSGTKKKSELDKLLKIIESGDRLIICEIDRLSRDANELFKLKDYFESSKIEFIILNQDINDFDRIAYFAEFENKIRLERQLNGIANAKRNGVKFGRNSKLTNEQILEMVDRRNHGISAKEVAKEYNISRASVYRLTKEYIASVV